MINWFKHRAYHNDAMARLMALTLLIGRDGEVLKTHGGIRDAIGNNFRDRTPLERTAVHLASALMADAIKRTDDPQRKQETLRDLADWSALAPYDQRAFSRQMSAGTLDQDMLLTRCQWLLIRGQDLLLDKKIDEHDFRILKYSIYGPLNGETSAQRTSVRIDDALDRILGRTA